MPPCCVVGGDLGLSLETRWAAGHMGCVEPFGSLVVNFLSTHRGGLTKCGNISFARAPASRSILFFGFILEKSDCCTCGKLKIVVGGEGKWENGGGRYICVFAGENSVYEDTGKENKEH